MVSAHALPLLISSTGTKVLLERVPLAGGSGPSAYNEAWLQEILYRYPQALPIADINPSFSDLIPVCRELATPAGPLDVLYVTSEGRLAVLEAKLWRNPEARRQVIGQILDYAKELSHWTYETLDAAVRVARRNRKEEPAQSLFDVVRSKHPDLQEAQFIDAVSRCLHRGDLLLLIAGDGIRENVGAITRFIEDHGTLHFTFGLVEMAIYRLPDDSHVIQPRVLAHSQIVRRIVVGMQGDQLDEADPEDVGTEAMPRPDLEQQRTRYSEFWKEWLAKYPLDDQSQPVRPPTRGTNQFFYMPKESKSWICAVAAEGSGKAGVYIAFPRNPVGDRIYAALLADQAAINAAIGQPVRWVSDGKYQGIDLWRDFGDQMLTKRRADVQAFLGDVVNRFINAFRPRIDAHLRDEGAD